MLMNCKVVLHVTFYMLILRKSRISSSLTCPSSFLSFFTQGIISSNASLSPDVFYKNNIKHRRKCPLVTMHFNLRPFVKNIYVYLTELLNSLASAQVQLIRISSMRRRFVMSIPKARKQSPYMALKKINVCSSNEMNLLLLRDTDFQHLSGEQENTLWKL
jgi:hypothetical protein